VPAVSAVLLARAVLGKQAMTGRDSTIEPGVVRMGPTLQRSVLTGFILALGQIAWGSADDFSQRGPAFVGQQTVQIRRSNGTECETVIFYPAENAGSQQRLDHRQAPYPVVVFISPVMPMSVYVRTLAHLASWGFVVLAPTDGLELFPDQAAIADDMRLCLDFIASENRRSQSNFHGAIDTERAGFCGHSWGGACSIIAGAKERDRVKVVVNLACWSKSVPSPLSCVGDLTCPLIMLTGDEDSLTPLDKVQSIYDAALPAKTLIVVRGGIHFGFLDDWFSFPSTGLCSPDQQLAIARHYMTAALLLHLRDAAELSPILWQPDAANFGNVIRKIDLGNASPITRRP
jgi:dienelactone hydrolase